MKPATRVQSSVTRFEKAVVKFMEQTLKHIFSKCFQNIANDKQMLSYTVSMLFHKSIDSFVIVPCKMISNRHGMMNAYVEIFYTEAYKLPGSFLSQKP